MHPMTGLPIGASGDDPPGVSPQKGRAHDHAKGYAGTAGRLPGPHYSAATMSAEGILTVGYVLWTLSRWRSTSPTASTPGTGRRMAAIEKSGASQ